MKNFLLKIFAAVTLVICTPLVLYFGFIAALYLLQQFVSGLNPLNWFSGSAADWVFGGGSDGSANNYLGSLISSALAVIFWLPTKWSFETLRKKSE